jgi:DNA mismatch repair protein MutL
LLDEKLVDQIAAGEVIERPANLVKELVENAIDAGARAITVAVEDGGRALVRVVDDGVGMSREDAALSVERHATSKIGTFDDLLRVSTLGFRGEALPSIGSVSRMTITTRLQAVPEGTRVVIEGGTRTALAPVGCPPGTTVEVEDLFFNVPARRKFLRARQTETSRIFEICQRMALGRPELRLVVTSDGRTARTYLPSRSLAERAYQVFGDLALREIKAERDGVMLEAALAPAELARRGARHLFLLVNGRSVVDRRLARAIAFSYGDGLAPGHYPRGVVSLRIRPEDVDVNAHPQKTEVRFRQVSQLLDRVTRMLAAHLPRSRPGPDEGYWRQRLGDAPAIRSDASDGSGERVPWGVAETQHEYRAQSVDSVILVAHVRNQLLVCETADELLLLDRERTDAQRCYDALSTASKSSEPPQRALLFPERLELSPPQQSALVACEILLRSLGFDWSSLGGDTFAVRAMPTALADARPAPTFVAALEAAMRRREDATDSVLRAVARALAVKNGEPISDEQARLIARGFRPSRADHGECVVARSPLTDARTDTIDE